MSAEVNPAASFFFGPASGVAISIQNSRTATTNATGELAWIQKKLTSTATTVSAVPAAVAF